jgi:hypothetical protein
MSIGRGAVCVVAAGLTLFAVGAVFHLAVPLVAPGIPPQFGNTALFRPWGGWTSTYMLLHPFGFGVVFAAVYLALSARGAVARGWRGGLVYGAGVFVVGSLPVYLLAFASFEVSPEVIAAWVAQSACQYTAAGAALGWVARRAEAEARLRG